MRRIRFILVTGYMLAALGTFAQQRLYTSTYPFNGLLLNPAYAGSLNILSVTAVHREQWINIDGAPSSQVLTAHSSFASNRIGTGLTFTRDRIGVHDDVGLYGSYAYKIKTPLGILAMGLQAGFDSRGSNFSYLTLMNESDPLLTGAINRFVPNFGTGVYFANRFFYAGASVPFLLENKVLNYNDLEGIISTGRESRYYYLTSGIVLPLSDLLKLSPSVLLRMQEQNRFAWDLTTNLIFEDIAYVGLSLRNSLDIVFIGQLILNENIRVGYAYDANTNALAPSTTGSHEILLNYRIKLRNYKKDPQCPVYF